MSEYAHTLHQSTLKALFELRLADLRKALREREALVANPFVEPDHERANADGGLMRHVNRGRFAIAYGVDHGAKLVSVTRLDSAD